jgi:hypothetical protein
MRSLRAVQPVSRALRPVPAIQAFRPIAPVFAQRHYAGEGSLAKDEVETRIIEILKGFDKVTDPAKVPSLVHPAHVVVVIHFCSGGCNAVQIDRALAKT